MGDSLPRQRSAVSEYARLAGYVIEGEYTDPAVSGADPLAARPGFMSLLGHPSGVEAILVENASRFARDLMVQENGHKWLTEMGIDLIAVDDPDAFTADTPTARLVRQMMGSIAEFEKASMVAKLKGARDRKSLELGRRVEGTRKVGGEYLRTGFGGVNPDWPAAARAFHSGNPGLTLRGIASEMWLRGLHRPDGSAFCPGTISRWLR
jgi:DNA invertase Pin-like site-specific DNA recombinase